MSEQIPEERDQQMVELNTSTVPLMSGVSTPSYDRSELRVGVVHFGMGNFHRSHEAVYLDRLMESGQALDWGICGVGLMAQDQQMRDVMRDQDCLYTLVLRGADGTLQPRVVGSVVKFLFGPDDPEAVYAQLLDPTVRIVSLTVTEGGYLKDAASGVFDRLDPSVVHDLTHPANPRTAFGYIVEALRRRWETGVQPFTVLSCDNLQGNGEFTRQTVTGFAHLVDAGLSSWIENNVAFPNCMVDRITPATSDADRASLREQFGIDDRWPVPAEPFTQWIVEDDFPSGRPEFEAVDVQFVDDVKPYELMKLRLLNASHQALAYFGASLGYVFVDDAMQDGLLREYLTTYMQKEAVPTLGELVDIDLDNYIDTLMSRFSNPHMRDTLVRLATDGSTRMATFTLPVLRENLAAGRPIEFGVAMVASWEQFWLSIGQGDPPAAGVPADERAETMIRAALASEHDPAAFLRTQSLFGNLAEDELFCEAFIRIRSWLATEGTRETLRRLIAT